MSPCSSQPRAEIQRLRVSWLCPVAVAVVGGLYQQYVLEICPFERGRLFMGRCLAGAARYKTTWKEPGEVADHRATGTGCWRTCRQGRSLERESPACCRRLPSQAHQSQERKSLPPATFTQGSCQQSLMCCQGTKGKCFKSPAQLSESRQKRADLELRNDALVTDTVHPLVYSTSFSALRMVEFPRSNNTTLHSALPNSAPDETQLHLLHTQ